MPSRSQRHLRHTMCADSTGSSRYPGSSYTWDWAATWPSGSGQQGPAPIPVNATHAVVVGSGIAGIGYGAESGGPGSITPVNGSTLDLDEWYVGMFDPTMGFGKLRKTDMSQINGSATFAMSTLEGDDVPATRTVTMLWNGSTHYEFADDDDGSYLSVSDYLAARVGQTIYIQVTGF